MNHYNEYMYDLPLQPVTLFPNTYKHRDMPKQIPQDVFRNNDKQNLSNNQHPSIHHLKLAPLIKGKQTDFKEEVNKIKMIQKDSKKQVLRDIINKQLSSNKKQSKKVIVIAEEPKKKIEHQYKPVNRYQQLLSQVYGSPNSTKNPAKIPKTIQLVRQNSLKRQSSLKQIAQKPKSRKLEHYQSQTNLKPSKSSGYKCMHLKQQKQKIVSPTYLQLYLQKRKGVLCI